MPHLRAAEWINILTFACLTLLAWGRRDLNGARRVKITAIGAGGLAITLFAALVLPRWASPVAASVARDWILYLLLLMVYRQGGYFVTHADGAFEQRLEWLDRRLVAGPLEWCARHRAGRWLLGYLELAYMLCYVSMPTGLAVLYLLGQRSAAGHFWTVVLLATYASYGTLPFLQTRPPRMLGEKWGASRPAGKLRAFNLWILRHASIHANTFPSAHVASSTACALVLLGYGPIWLGIGFLWIAFSIALGAVAGRYHYAADAILGALVALVALLVENALTVYGWAG
jgi:hypothetical protein